MQLFPKTRAGRIRLLVILGVFLATQLGLVGCVALSMIMPGKSHRGPLAPLTAEEVQLRDRLKAHIVKLAGEIGVRDLEFHPRATAAAIAYIHAEFEAAGYAVQEQTFPAFGKTAANLEVELKGAAHPEEILVVGGHYDSTPETPGADDNASGVAATLELARLLRGKPLARTVRFVAFANEEPPHFQTETMGSMVYARRCRERNEKIAGMLSLETVAYYSDAHKSQQYPYPFNLFYPATGDFIGFVGNVASRHLVHQAIGSFRRHTPFPSEGTAAPGVMTGIGWSDHWAFWQMGYPALMVTDTAPFRNPNYHMPTDTPETLDYDRTARVVAGLARVIEELAQGSPGK